MNIRLNRFVNARSLFSRAGRVRSLKADRSGETSFEPLEERKLLFALTITPDMDFNGDGLGTATAQFAYTVPYLAPTEQIQQSEADTVLENFDDEPNGTIVSGTIFAESDFRVTHNMGNTGNFRTEFVDPNNPGDQYLKINASNGSFWQFEPMVVDDQTPPQFQPFNRAATATSFRIFDDDNKGLLPAGFVVDFLFFNDVVASFTTTELMAFNNGTQQDQLNGIGTFNINPGVAFTAMRFRSGVSEDLKLDDLSFTLPTGVFADIVESRIFGADISFTAPIGATVEINDLYGRDMVNTLGLGKPDGFDLNLVDLDDDGVPNFNDGIGQIRFSGVDSRARFTMFGGTVDSNNGAFVYTRADSFVGNYDDFEGAGFGYQVEYDQGGQPTLYGLPGGPGSVIVGSPYVRDNTNSGTYNPNGQVGSAVVSDGFSRDDQGVFVTDGQSMGTIYIHGVVHGSSQFTGAVGDVYFGTLMGSVNVEGDLGALYIGSDAGLVNTNDGAQNPQIFSTNSRLTVGRTVGEVAIGGRSALNTLVVGDLSNAQARPPRDSFRYVEHESTYAFDNSDNPEATIMGIISQPSSDIFGNLNLFTNPAQRSPIFNTSTLRNDTILGAEFVGSIASAVQISGTIGYGDPINADEDPVDMFAFAVDGTEAVSFQVNTPTNVGLVRVLDQNGVPLAATERERGTLTSQTVTFTPPHAGVYYLEVSDVGINLVDGANGSGYQYSVTIAGITPTTLGSFRTAASAGIIETSGRAQPNLISVLNGSVGAIRLGVGYVGPDGNDTDPTSLLNMADGATVDNVMDVIDAVISVPGDLMSFVAGSDIQNGFGFSGNTLFVGGDLGQFFVGQSPVVGGGAGDGLQGDVTGMSLTVNGRIAEIDIKGDVGISQDPDPDAFTVFGIDITTGNGGGDGSIGSIRVGGDINGGTFTLHTSPGSIVGTFLVSQDKPDGNGIYQNFFQTADFVLGNSSDIRFVDFPRIDILNNADHSIPLTVGTPVELVDDGGGIVTVEVQGAGPGAFAGQIRIMPIDKGQGVAIARLDNIDLTGGRTLLITSTGRLGGTGQSDAPISIGRVNITGADALSSVQITGTVEVDVWQIVQTGGAAFNTITNTSPFGDIVAIDVVGLNDIQIGTGDLGRTQVPAFGPTLIGPRLGIALDEQGTVGGALGVPQAVLSPIQNLAGTFRPAGTIGGNYLDDIGSVLDPYLNGAVIRTGNVNLVSVGGSIGDVILQGGGELGSVVADADFLVDDGGFDGIFGNIYAQNINRVDVGSGLVESPRAPFVTSSIVASDEIRNIDVLGLTHPGAFLASLVVAGNLTNNPAPDGSIEVGGIGQITIDSGDIRHAYIGAMDLDDFRTSYSFGEGGIFQGTIASITATNSTLFSSEISANFVQNIELSAGVFDANTINVGANAGTLNLGKVRNSTLEGGDFEFHLNNLQVGNNIDTLTMTDASDFVVDVVGRMLTGVTADNLQRVDLSVNNQVPDITATGAIAASEINVGELESISADAFRASSITVSGKLTSVTATSEIFNTRFNVTGPEGEIGSIVAATRFTGEVISSGPVGSLSTTEGDMDISLTTFGSLGTVDSLSAARDLILDTSISSTVSSISAGRHLGSNGSSGLLFIQGDLPTMTIAGHIFSDVRVGGTISSATIGAVVNKPGNEMGHSGSLYAAEGIGTVSIAGDFGGNIVSYTGGIQSVTITNGSLLSTGSVRAYDGNVESVVIQSGNLYGDIYADWNITSLQVLASSDGVFGDIGVNETFSAGTSYDSMRSQLPPGTIATNGSDGPMISAGLDIDSILVSRGAIFETTIYAGRTINNVEVHGNFFTDFVPGNTGQNVIAAGESIQSIVATGSVRKTQVIAGVRSLGADNAPGGVGDNADVTQSGSIGTISISHNFVLSTVAAGMNPGADGIYNTSDDTLEIGVSSIGAITVGGDGTGTTVFSDQLNNSSAGGKLATGGFARDVNNSDIATETTGTQLTKGSAFAFSTSAGSGSIVFSGPGNAFFDAATSRVILDGTNGSSNLTVTATGDGSLTDFDIVSTEGASVGTIRVRATLFGDSDIVIDENATRIVTGGIDGTGTIQTGATLSNFVSGPFLGGQLLARDAGSILVSGNFGATDTDVRGEATMLFRSVDSVLVKGQMAGSISAIRTLTSLVVEGDINGGLVHAGQTIDSISANALSRSRLSTGDTINTVTIAGDVFDTSIMAGGDLGDDGEIGGSGVNSDVVSAGFIGTITIGGDFTISDIVAGYLRGPDGFFGTSDDLLASGRSSIDSVSIAGTSLGSNRSTESYRIGSTGTLGTIDATDDRNFVIETQKLDPLPIQVLNVDTQQEGRLFKTFVQFNQPIDLSSLTRGLSVSQVRGTGQIEVRLIQGAEYTISDLGRNNTIVITYDASVTERDLPVVGDLPGPGVYRITIEDSEVRARGALALLDGNSDGRSDGGEIFSSDTIVGDAGDKLQDVSFDVAGTNGSSDTHIDFYSPTNLDIILDNNENPDGLPDANSSYLLRGFIGDHPDNNNNSFSFSSDADIYSVSLQAGQILRLSAMQGAASLAGRYIIQPDGAFLQSGSTDFALTLPSDPGDLDNPSLAVGENFLIRQTGTYFIVIANHFQLDANTIPNIDPVPSGVGDYNFTVTVFDDGDSGFNATTDSGDGLDLVNAPLPSAFAGNDNTLGTGDDLNQIVIGAYTFTLDSGADGVVGTTDDFVIGDNGDNVSSTSNTLGTQTVSVNAAIGDPGASGLPSKLAPDVDIFHLNGGNPIPTGTVVRVTLKLSDLGADLGARLGNANRSISLSNLVQFAIFDTTNATGSDDAVLLYSPTDISPTGNGDPGVIASSDDLSYGYDDNGDFYIEFAAPGRMDLPGADAKYAVYVQGVINTDYRLEVVTGGSKEVVARKQNILLETNGGSVDWLEIGGVKTELDAFAPSVLGFTGNASNGQPVEDFIFNRVTSIMQSTFDDVVVGAGGDGLFGTADDVKGVNITVSTNPADFEFQDFSTIFLTSSINPIGPIFDQSGLAAFFAAQANNTLFTQPYGVSEHVDVGNANRNDEAILFMPAFTVLGYTPSSEDIENFSESIAAAATRRVGELVGLRLTENYDPAGDLFDVMAANSVEDIPGSLGNYSFPVVDRRLSNDQDTAVDSDFFLGYQNSAQLLSLYVSDA